MLASALKRVITTGCLFAMAYSFQAAAVVFDFSDFSDLSDFQLNGDTALLNPGGTGVTGPNPGDGPVLRLTTGTSTPSVGTSFQAGSAFLTDPISLLNEASFSTKFDFQFTEQGGLTQAEGNGADGIVFVVQTVSNTAGTSGAGIGYEGLTNSLGIEFDNWNNFGSFGDPNANHVAINTNGVFSPIGPLTGDLSALGLDLDAGDILTAWIDYDGITDGLEVRVAAGGASRPGAAFLSTIIDLETTLGSSSAFVGFTSATGSAFANHDIRNWTFRDDFNPVVDPPPTTGIPEPSTWALIMLAMFALVLHRRRALAKAKI
ncbi:MAG: PEP-CTERM sorting domain-containing protein [Pseudomonadota bacterium]